MSKVSVKNSECNYEENCPCDECENDRIQLRKATKRKDPKHNQAIALESVGGKTGND
jgi:hypothetical protein